MRYIFQGTHLDNAGFIIPSGTCSVYLAGSSTPASIYIESSGGSALNSVDIDTNGRFVFYVDDGDYNVTQLFKVTLSKAGYSDVTADDVRIIPGSAFIATLLDDTTAAAARTTLDAPGLSVDNVFSGDITISSPLPRSQLHDSDGPTDEKYWSNTIEGGDYYIRAYNDLYSASDVVLSIGRTGTTPGAWGFTGASFTFNTGYITVSGTTPRTIWHNSGAGTDEKDWYIDSSGGTLYLAAANEAFSVANAAFSITRTGATVGAWSFYGTGFTFNTGTVDMPTGSTVNSSAILTLASGGNITTAPTINSEDILTLGNAPVDTVSSAEDAAGGTVSTTVSNLVTLDLGTVTSGDVFLVGGSVELTKDTTAARVIVNISQDSGTATVSFAHDSTTIPVLDIEIPSNDTRYSACHGVPMKVSSSGTLVLKMNGISSSGDATYSSGDADISAIQLYNA